jgi:DNA-binding MarR family transcriptional regulator
LHAAPDSNILRVALTIYEGRTNVTTPESTDRSVLIARLLDEFSSGGAKDALRHMRHWPGGKLSLVHLNVMMTLDADGALPMGALAEAMDVSQASVTGIVDRMEQRGLVERQRDDEDRRVVRVALTDEGRQLIGTLAAQRREHMAQLLEDLTEDELQGFLIGVRGMRRARERRYGVTESTTSTQGATG